MATETENTKRTKRLTADETLAALGAARHIADDVNLKLAQAKLNDGQRVAARKAIAEWLKAGA